MAPRIFETRVDRELCFSCGICMDVCPVRALDMTRPAGPGPEGNFERDTAEGKPWMTEFPVLVDKCIGCLFCQEECPTGAITVHLTSEQPLYAPKQGVIYDEPESLEGWVPLSAVTRAANRPPQGRDPWPNGQWKTMAQKKKRQNRFF